ncbi:MAG: DUF1211 domain-containing protein [Sphingomonadales bacterium]|jgi:uncharacterized membrane protein|nr:DUF1211 domain-containing protein [Sphingomonadales bacterium]
MSNVPEDHVDHPLERLMFFSDAVFAIAITLLVIEIKVPHLHTQNPAEAWEGVRGILPSLFGYVLSFLVIGRFWIGHHTALQAMEHHTSKLIWPNIFLLMAVAFMPFATAFMAENLHNSGPTTFYNLALLFLAVCSLRVVSIATAPGHTRPGFSETTRRTMIARSMGVIVTVLITLAATFAFTSGGISQMLLALMPLVQRVLIKLSLSRMKPAVEPAEA